MQGKHITLCKVPFHMGIKGNEIRNKVTKETPGIPRIATIKIIYKEQTFIIRRGKN